MEKLELVCQVLMARGIDELERMFWPLRLYGHSRLCAEIAYVLCNFYLDRLNPNTIDAWGVFYARCWIQECLELLDQLDEGHPKYFTLLWGVVVPEPLTRERVQEELAKKGLSL